MFSKILIANRGEIAVRIIRACKEMGIATVAVYSTADAGALHTALADERVCIGPANPADSYLNEERILSAALATGAKAIHPGYGFLSENAHFAALCRKNDLVFIGPSAEAMDQLSDKAAIKALMAEAGLPAIPGSGVLNSVSEALTEAERIGYPVMLKARSFGAPNPEGYRKALRLMRQAEKFHRPVVCFIDTSGAYCGIGAEERGHGQAIAENLMEMMTLDTPILSILIGEGGSGGAFALAVADRVWMLENAVYSVISPEGCASILWKDAGQAATAAENLKLTAQNALTLSVIERMIPEVDLGSPSFYADLRNLIHAELAELSSDSGLLQQRYARFRRMGTPALRREPKS